MRKEEYSKSYSDATQRKNLRIRQRKRQKIRILAITAALIAVILFFGWNALKSPFNSKQIKETKPSSNTKSSSITATIPAPQNNTDWNLTLVNPWKSVPKGYKITLEQLKNGHSVDKRCYPDLQKMMDDCRAAGLSPLICSSYRTQQEQEQLYNDKVDSLISQGYSQDNAKTEAGKAVAVPGTSEHQLGLVVDIVDINNQNLDSSQEKTEVQQWLMQNSWKYGFILRYPSDKGEITGIMYEPWHYRYVGKEAAEYIYKNGICLEEYLEQLS